MNSNERLAGSIAMYALIGVPNRKTINGMRAANVFFLQQEQPITMNGNNNKQQLLQKNNNNNKQ